MSTYKLYYRNMALAPNTGYFRLNPYRARPTSGTSGMFGSQGFFKVNPIHPHSVISPGGSGSTPPPNDPNGGFYPYNDYYGSLLTKLASMRDLALSGIKTDLEGRTKAVQGIVDASRAPLNSNYSTAIQEAAAVNDAVANRLGTQGTGGTEDLRSKLASLGQDPNAATADLSKYYSGLGGANYAMDSGDVQRLIGRQAEENTLLNKQPLLVGQQLNQDYSKEQGDIINEFLGKSFDLSQAGAEDRANYDKAKFDFQQTQASNALDQSNKAESLYWDNYWKKQDMLFRKWQTNIASHDKAGADETRKQIAAAQRQAQIDIANIRAKTASYKADQPKPMKNANINGHAATYDPNTGTYYYSGTQNPVPQSVLDTWSKKAAGKGSKNAPSNVNRSRAYTASLNAVIDPKTGILRSGINPSGYNADWTMTRIINQTLKGFGINPDTPQGRSIKASVMSQASGRRFSGGAIDPTTGKPAKFHYDPNWVKGAQNSVAKKQKKKNYNSR